MPRTTRRISKKGKALKAQKVLKVDSEKKVPMFNSLIKSGSVTFVLVYADWCGACTRFKKNIWNPMCNGPARHNLAMVDAEMIKKTSLANADFEYLPSIILVDGEGKMHGFQKPDGTNTHAMPTPQSLGEMKKAVNSPITPSSPTMAETLENTGPSADADAEADADADAEAETEEQPQLTIEPITTPNANPLKNNNISAPKGQSYLPVSMPTPMVAPQKGGAKKSILPKIVLGSLARLLRSRRRSNSGKRITRKHSKRITLIKRKN
jgi:hypothetical protein